MKKIFSYFIILTFSSIVFGGAGFSIKKGLDEESNWNYIAHVVENYQIDTSNVVSAKESENTIIDQQVGNELNSLISRLRSKVVYQPEKVSPVTKVLGENTDSSCDTSPKNEILQAQTVHEFFKHYDGDTSFRHRAEAAQENGIQNYTGSAEQNRLLVHLMKEKVIACK